jgi:hypothetical protein
LPVLNRIGQREGIPAQEVDVVEDQALEAGKVLRFDEEPLGAKLLQSGIDVKRVPEHDNVDDQAETLLTVNDL